MEQLNLKRAPNNTVLRTIPALVNEMLFFQAHCDLCKFSNKKFQNVSVTHMQQCKNSTAKHLPPRETRVVSILHATARSALLQHTT